MDPNQPQNTSEEPDIQRPASVAPTEDQLERETPVSHTKPHDPYLALRQPGYSLFSTGWMIAVIGNQITAAAIAWEIYNRIAEHDSAKAKLALGYVAGIQAIP